MLLKNIVVRYSSFPPRKIPKENYMGQFTLSLKHFKALLREQKPTPTLRLYMEGLTQATIFC
jgi:hypothetical protein